MKEFTDTLAIVVFYLFIAYACFWYGLNGNGKDKEK